MTTSVKYLAILTCTLFSSKLVRSLCSLEGYDLGTLNDAPYWTARVEDPKNCLLPLGYTQDQVESCDIYYSACRPLGNACGSYINSSSCQRVVANNTEYFFDMGTFNPYEEYQLLGGNKQGFSVVRSTAYSIIGEDCNNTVLSITTFVCDSQSMWDPEGENNVTSYLMSVREIFAVKCLYVIEFRYAGGCYLSPTLSPSHCSIDEYDTDTLKNKEYWMATVDPSACYDSSVSHCVFYLSFCHPIPPSIGSICYGSSVCQVGTLHSGETRALSMGTYTRSTRFHENKQAANGSFFMRVEHGSRPSNGSICPKGISTQVTLVCDNSSSWNNQDIARYMKGVYHHENDPCSYILIIWYSGACNKQDSMTTSQRPTLTAASLQLHYLWLNLIALLVPVAVIGYLSLGIIYNKLKKGATGVRLIPNYNFWFSLVKCVQCECCYPNHTTTADEDSDKLMEVPAE